jgi:periplasmic protein TonB
LNGHPFLVAAALEAVKQWVYQPTLVGGEAVQTVTEVDVPFTLNR